MGSAALAAAAAAAMAAAAVSPGMTWRMVPSSSSSSSSDRPASFAASFAASCVQAKDMSVQVNDKQQLHNARLHHAKAGKHSCASQDGGRASSHMMSRLRRLRSGR